ncbi:hypothetical protein EV363DRAFT_1393010 [Boletus edulis]|nr:hypothetical protein EV363DRAFT_1393010 [Boletus edulis]
MYRSYSRVLFWILEACYAVIILIVACLLAVSCFALLQQAVRTAPHGWNNNWDTVTIGATYCLVLLLSIAFCIKRRIAVRRRLQRISKTHSGINRHDLPQPVHEYISQEFARSCLISYECQPRDTTHPGWGKPGTEHGGTRFRRSLLDTIADIDARAHLVIPNLPPLKPHCRMIHHFRFEGLTPLHYYDSAIQLARTSTGEPTEDEFTLGLRAADEIRRILNDCRIEMLEESRTQLSVSVQTTVKP